MSDKSSITWTNATWNPVTGCTKVSSACKHCYAERDWVRLVHLPTYAGREFTDVACHPERLAQPLRWSRPRMVFVNSMSDLFHEDIPNAFIDKVFAVMAHCRHHTFQVLTKRPERMLKYLTTNNRSSYWSFAAKDIEHELKREWESVHGYGRRRPAHLVFRPDKLVRNHLTDGGDPYRPEYSMGDFPGKTVGNAYIADPLPNVWLGVSVEDQETADERIPLLLRTPAAVRWISAEPLLAPIILADVPVGMEGPLRPNAITNLPRLDWVVVGGESGPKARITHPDWARNLRDECERAGAPLFFKQTGVWQALPPGEAGKKECRDKETRFQFGTTFVKSKGGGSDLLDGRKIQAWPAGSVRPCENSENPNPGRAAPATL